MLQILDEIYNHVLDLFPLIHFHLFIYYLWNVLNRPIKYSIQPSLWAHWILNREISAIEAIEQIALIVEAP